VTPEEQAFILTVLKDPIVSHVSANKIHRSPIKETRASIKRRYDAKKQTGVLEKKPKAQSNVYYFNLSSRAQVYQQYLMRLRGITVPSSTNSTQPQTSSQTPSRCKHTCYSFSLFSCSRYFQVFHNQLF
jgi:hypothetical protein